MGTTGACLKQAGTCPMHRDSLKSKVKEEARWYAQVLSRQGGMFSDPVSWTSVMDSRTGLWGTKKNRRRFATECNCD